MIQRKLIDRKRLLASLAAAASLAGAGVAAPAAGATQPWWHVTAEAIPGNLRAGVGQDEVQEIKIAATGGEFILVNMTAWTFGFFKWDATHEEVQQGLEAMYGAGNVEVPEGQGDATGSKPYKVIFTGELADRPVEPVFASSYFLLPEGVAEATVTEVARGHADGTVVLSATNVGDAGADGAVAPVTIASKLAAGLKPVSIEAVAGTPGTTFERAPVSCEVSSLSCAFTGLLPPYERIEVKIQVIVEHQSSGEVDVNVSGGGAPSYSTTQTVGVSEEPTPFGVGHFEVTPEAEGGAAATQAGSHRFQLTTTLTTKRLTITRPVQPLKDVRVTLPAGLVGNVTGFPQCTDAQFEKIFNMVNGCTAETAVGAASLTIFTPIIKTVPETMVVPVFNLTPRLGEPARFGFEASGVFVYLDTTVRAADGYRIGTDVKNITETASLLGSVVTLWGVPGDPSHDSSRGWSCIAGEGWRTPGSPSCAATAQAAPPPLLTLPTSCASGMQATGEADSWVAQDAFVRFAAMPAPPGLDGCNQLPFSPEVQVQAGTSRGATPSALAAALKVPQEAGESADALAEADVRDTTVTLPAGLQINPAAAGGLAACTEGQIGYAGRDPQTGQLRFDEESEAERNGEAPHRDDCPEASKLGAVQVTTPLLKEALEGYVYQAAQAENPFGSLLAVYVIAEAPRAGIRVRLAGEVKADPATGRLTATFPNTPQLPFEAFQLKLFGGEKAPLATTSCGVYRTESSIEPWSATPAVHPFSQFDVTSGPEGSPAWCERQPFAPSFVAGTTNNAAGAFSPFTLALARTDADQTFDAVTTTLPLGLAGEVSKVTPCGEPQAQSGDCPADSQIGHVVVQAGLGREPITLPEAGQSQDPVYLTGPYDGAPFGLAVVVPARAGPFDLDQGGPPIVVRARIEIDPKSAQVTVAGDPMPQMIHSTGIPSDVRAVDVVIDRPEFTFNPTSCEPTAISGTISSAQGAVASVSSRFQASECRSMRFKPGFSVLTHAAHSKPNGEYLHVVVTSAAGQANVRSVHVSIPKTLPARLSTLNHACSQDQFAANPAGCPPSSFVGTATARTPVLPVPLTGPAIFVSHGGAAFPDLDLVLQGDGVTLVLTGNTFIDKAGVTSSTFASVPDVPFSRFDLVLPPGPHSALAAEGDLCAKRLSMPTTIAGQNGALVRQRTRIGVLGCRPALRVLSRSVSGPIATIAVSVPSAGRLVARGSGLSRAMMKLRRRGVARLQLRISRDERRLLAHHRGRRLSARVKLVFTPVHGPRLRDVVTVLVR